MKPFVAIASAIALSLAAAVPARAEMPFVGTWDCEVAVFKFTEDTYNNGETDMPIEEVQEGSDGSYTLLFADGYFITVGDFTADTMTWLSGESGDAFQCRRVN